MRKGAGGVSLLSLAEGAEGEEEEEERGVGDGTVVRPEDLEGYKKRRRASKVERLMKIVGGKSSFEHTGHRGGLTNAEKERKKNFVMVRRLVVCPAHAVSLSLSLCMCVCVLVIWCVPRFPPCRCAALVPPPSVFVDVMVDTPLLPSYLNNPSPPLINLPINHPIRCGRGSAPSSPSSATRSRSVPFFGWWPRLAPPLCLLPVGGIITTIHDDLGFCRPPPLPFPPPAPRIHHHHHPPTHHYTNTGAQGAQGQGRQVQIQAGGP